MGIENIKDIIALGFDMDKTFIFMDTEYVRNINFNFQVGHMYKNVCKF